MILTKCDRCGKLYEDHSTVSSIGNSPLGVATFTRDNYTDYTVHDTYDLCEECADDFLDFLEGVSTYGTR